MKYNINFEPKEGCSGGYYLPVFKDKEIYRYGGSSDEIIFKGNHFSFYENTFDSLTCSLDFNTGYYYWDSSAEVPMNEDLLVGKLKQLYITFKFLNLDKDYSVIYHRVIKDIAFNSNFFFNVDYVMDLLVPDWDSEGQDTIEDYIKVRNWKVISPLNIKHFVEFNILKGNDHKRMVVVNTLRDSVEAMENFEFIDAREVLPRGRATNKLLYELIQKYNVDVTGCKTVKKYHNYCLLDQFFINRPEKMSCKKIMKETGVSERHIIDYRKTTRDKKKAKAIVKEVKDILRHPLTFKL
tara:strand:- start:311 stop:1195 length:885 start_codon:yes stop_codon:yes gene_type:complete